MSSTTPATTNGSAAATAVTSTPTGNTCLYLLPNFRRKVNCSFYVHFLHAINLSLFLLDFHDTIFNWNYTVVAKLSTTLSCFLHYFLPSFFYLSYLFRGQRIICLMIFLLLTLRRLGTTISLPLWWWRYITHSSFHQLMIGDKAPFQVFNAEIRVVCKISPFDAWCRLGTASSMISSRRSFCDAGDNSTLRFAIKYGNHTEYPSFCSLYFASKESIILNFTFLSQYGLRRCSIRVY